MKKFLNFLELKKVLGDLGMGQIHAEKENQHDLFDLNFDYLNHDFDLNFVLNYLDLILAFHLLFIESTSPIFDDNIILLVLLFKLELKFIFGFTFAIDSVIF